LLSLSILYLIICCVTLPHHLTSTLFPYTTRFRSWIATDGEHILVNTSEDRQKARNVERDPRVAVNVVDPNDAWRVANIRGRVVEMTTDGADELIDQLAQKYLGEETYPFRQPGEVRVTLKIAPEHINAIGLD